MSLFPADAETPQILIQNAEAALHHAKETSGWRFFVPTMNQESAERFTIEAGLRRALREYELEVYFQPLIGVRSRTIHGAEAVLRWNAPQGMISTVTFIPVAEASDLIVPIGAWVLHAACREAKRWETDGFPIRVAVNISSRQFRGDHLPTTVRAALEEQDLAPDRLELEITESLLIDDIPGVVAALEELDAIGVTLALDDFGTGYSSLQYLKSLPFHVLKIDRAFVKDIGSDAADVTLVTAIVGMAHGLGLRVVAEGVENRNQLDVLRRLGCDVIQGYYCGRPMPASDFRRQLRASGHADCLEQQSEQTMV
ncbi:MAG: signal transduction protein [Rhodospirillaceae bacterium]|nr:MAG: signal transduction protein [Rhodospirillaceae bacterium]